MRLDQRIGVAMPKSTHWC